MISAFGVEDGICKAAGDLHDPAVKVPADGIRGKVDVAGIRGKLAPFKKAAVKAATRA